jgi:hypothetical protein
MTRSISCALVCGLAAGLVSAEPVSQNLSIERLATIEDMGRMAVNPVTGEVAFGSTGPGSSTSRQFIRVMQPDGSVSSFGNSAMPDPDAVAWDMDGSFGPAGSILVGGFQGMYSVNPQGDVFQFAFRGQDLMNPEDMVVGADGSLYFADYGLSQVKRLSVHGSFSTLIDTPMPAKRVLVDERGNASALDSSGLLTSETLSGVNGTYYSDVEIGHESLGWDGGTYAVDASTGELMRILSDGTKYILASGLLDGVDLSQPNASDAHIGFTPTGEMLVAIPATGAVYSLVPAPGAVVIAGLGGLLSIRRKR